MVFRGGGEAGTWSIDDVNGRAAGRRVALWRQGEALAENRSAYSLGDTGQGCRWARRASGTPHGLPCHIGLFGNGLHGTSFGKNITLFYSNNMIVS